MPPAPGAMDIMWLGCAGFSIRTRHSHILLDPFLSRNSQARPVQPLTPETLVKERGPFQAILLSHGHFDHLADVPSLANRMPRAKIYCHEEPARTLVRNGVPRSRIHTVSPVDGPFSLNGIQAQCLASHHIRFDPPLVWATLKRMGRKWHRLIPLFHHFPSGRVLAWRLDIQGKTLLFMGSACTRRPALDHMAKRPIDLLLIPLQGHSRICDIAAHQVKILCPEQVFPHHMDDFYPPMSQAVDIHPFCRKIRTRSPATRLVRPRINHPFSL